MTTSPRSDRERAEDEAAAWLVLLTDEPDSADLRARFETWRTASDLNAEIWARTSRAYDLIGKGPSRHTEHWASYAAARGTKRALPPARPAAPTIRRMVGGSRPRLRFTPGRVGAVIASAALVALLTAWVLPGLLLRMEADVVTSTAELRTVTLQDGTQVRLAPESAIAVAFADRERRVRLVRGDAFFDVSPDGARPFHVVAGDTVATVLGTAFEVRRGEDGVLVGVKRGVVRVDDNGTTPPTSERLQAGDSVRVTWHGGAVRGSMSPEDVADWQQGELVARNRPVGEIIEALRRYYLGVILVRNDAFAARRVSGIYDLRDPAKTLGELAASHGAAVRQLSPWLLIVTAQ